MNAKAAYDKGYRASQRSASGDMDAAESRFIAAYGSRFVGHFVDGWSDEACGNGKWHDFVDAS